MAYQEKPLGQLRGTTTAVSVYSPDDSVTGIIATIDLCNVTGSAVTFKLFLDADGTTYDESTAFAFNSPLTANQTLTMNAFRTLSNSSGNLAFSCDPTNSVTITVHGAEIS